MTRRGANSISPRNRRVEAYDNSIAWREDWICFFRERLEEIKDSEVEHENEEIVKFCWPTEVLEILDNPVETFSGSLSGIRRIRDDITFQVRKMTKVPKPMHKMM